MTILTSEKKYLTPDERACYIVEEILSTTRLRYPWAINKLLNVRDYLRSQVQDYDEVVSHLAAETWEHMPLWLAMRVARIQDGGQPQAMLAIDGTPWPA